ncbi:uncharacterized protein HGUI_00135 [Hanseniaspora guilliermondii]|uniref:MI domain-containing protein n=1 Tax=Hanseniaspora guilliermondii TaxID=56406 RepID=A0A1L0CT54_9ASCO|nr:uncharacterized protein HGUI_00135 [Hanseniaspora guilliermondii]
MSTGKKGKHIQLPKSLMTEISGISENNENGSLPYSRKRKYQNNARGRMTRKERRKLERNDKKRKLNNNKSKNVSNTKSLAKEKPRIEERQKKEETTKELDIPTDDSLDSDDFDDFDEDDLTKEEWKQLRELEGGNASSSSSSSDISSDDDSEEETFIDESSTKLSVTKLKPAIKQKLNKKVISKTQKKHVTFNKKIHEKLIPARENYGEYDVSSDDDSYLDELDLSDSSDDVSEDENEMSVEETMAALKAAKENKDVASDSEDEFHSAEEYSSEEDQEMSVEETMAALKAAKEKKNKNKLVDEREMTVEETMAALKAVKENKNKTSNVADEINSKELEFPEVDSDEDERNMRYYAKKLKLNSKSKKLKAMDEYDAIGGLLEGLDFFDDYGKDLEDYGDLEIKEDDLTDSDSEESESEASDEEVYDDFDENDLTPDEWKQLRELEDSEGEYGDYSEEEEEEEVPKTKKNSSKKKQNLYGLDTELDDQDKEIIQNLEKDDDQIDEKLEKEVKSLYNKLSETNINNIISSLLDLFNTYSRQVCMNAIIKRIIIDCNINDKLLDQYLMNYIGTVYAIWKFKGVDFGASFIQKLVEKIISFLDTNTQDDDNNAKNGSNLVTLLSYCFNFGIITNKLIYNLLDLFAEVSNETSVELILQIVSVSGILLRGENPKELNNVINKLLINLEETTNEDDSRLQFLVDTLKDLRMNKIDKNLTAKTNHSNMKKSITKSLKIDTKTLGNNSSQAIQVSLDDILNIDTKGKWWLIGGSYRGNMSTDTIGDDFTEDEKIQLDNDIEFSDIKLHDDFIDELPDYNQLAEQNKMSSQLSKAMFVGISSAQDPLDCIMRLDKLNIKKKNYQELLRVLVHVSKLDTQYNPFYEMVIIRLNKNMPGFNKTIKFYFWDAIKNFESNNDEDDIEGILTSLYGEFGKQRDSKITQEARLFGSLIAHKIIPFDVFKHVPILDGLTSEGELFINSLIYQLLLKTAKECEQKTTDKNKKKNIIYDEDKLHEIIFNTIQQENELIIYKQLQWFMDNKFDYEEFEFTNEPKKEKRRFEWAFETFKNGINENIKYLE